MSELYLSVVAPCYNEQEVLPALHARVSAVCAALGKSYEIILVNDGSRDETWRVMMDLSKIDPHVVLLNLSRNHGHQLALTAGLSIVQGQRILILDADLQDPPELLPQMLERMDQGVDLVYAQRRSRPGDAKLKALACAIFYRLLQRLSDTPIPLDTGDFRLLSRRIVDHLNAMPERHRFLRGLGAWVGYRQEGVLYDRDARAAGETKYPLRKLIALGVDGMTSFSVKPLHLATYLSLIMAAFGGCLLVYSFVSIFFKLTPPPPGWTSTMSAIAIISSMQFLVLGIIGDYVGRLYEQSKGRPLFIVERIVRAESGTEPAKAATAESGHANAHANPPKDTP